MLHTRVCVRNAHIQGSSVEGPRYVARMLTNTRARRGLCGAICVVLATHGAREWLQATPMPKSEHLSGGPSQQVARSHVLLVRFNVSCTATVASVEGL